MIRRLAAASAALLVASELSACSHGGAVACEPTSRYAAASTAGPVQIPDDLNPPDETDSLRLPPDNGRAAPPSKACLETPPGFYADGAPANPRGTPGQRRSGAPAPGPRQAAPPPAAAPAPTPAPAPAQSEPPPAATPAPPPADAPPPGGDREITN